MSEGIFGKSIWDSLSQDTKEVCESIGSVSIGLDTFNEMYDDIAEKTLKELKEKGLIEEMTLEEELKRKTEGFDETQIRQRIVQPKFEGFLPGEKDALNAFDRLKLTNEDQLSSKRLRLTPDFGKFVENEIQYRKMSKLEEIFQKIKEYPNGEQVAKRITQIWDFALGPDDEPLTAESVIQVIKSHEEKLLQRTQLEMISDKPILPLFEIALRQSSDEEWENFKKEHGITPLGKLDRERLFVDASGLVRDTGFEEWVLGKESSSVNIEGKINLHRVIRKERINKE